MSIREALLQNDNVYVENKLYYQKNLSRPGPFEKVYLELRKKENRLYSETLIRSLPEIPGDHSLRPEWDIRKKSFDLLVNYLVRKSTVKSILEVGCGNGWLSYRLAQELPAEICGLDINEVELKQAIHLSADQSRLSFVYGSIWEAVLPPATFDVIILASSVQYFPDLKLLTERLLKLSSRNGEIHVLDSPFYRSAREAEAALERSRHYFAMQGFPQMADHYFHHTLDALNAFEYSLMYNPFSWWSRFRKKIIGLPLSPFPWIRISANEFR